MKKTCSELLGGTLAGIMFLSGCSLTTETNKTPVVEVESSPTATDVFLPTPTNEIPATATSEATTEAKDVIVQSETLFKSEKYPWFKGIDVSGLKIPDNDTVVFDSEKVDLMISSYLKVIETQVPGVGEKNSNVDIYIPVTEKIASGNNSWIAFKKVRIDVSKGLSLEIGDGNQANTVKISKGRFKDGSADFVYYRINEDGSLTLGIGKSKFDGLKAYLGESRMNLYKEWSKNHTESGFLLLLEMLGHVNEVGVDWRDFEKNLYDLYYYRTGKTLGFYSDGRPFNNIVVENDLLLSGYLIDSQE